MRQAPSPASRMGQIMYQQKYSTAAPTQTHIESFAIAKEEYQPIFDKLKAIAENDFPAMEKKLEKYKAPYTPGRALRMMNGN